MWSPQTAPARQAEIAMIRISLPTGNTSTTIGMRMENVPQDVPVAKARNSATTKMIAGSMMVRPLADPSSIPATNCGAPREDLVMPPMLHASTRIRIAGTMALKPSARLSVNSR